MRLGRRFRNWYSYFEAAGPALVGMVSDTLGRKQLCDPPVDGVGQLAGDVEDEGDCSSD